MNIEELKQGFITHGINARIEQNQMIELNLAHWIDVESGAFCYVVPDGTIKNWRITSIEFLEHNFVLVMNKEYYKRIKKISIPYTDLLMPMEYVYD